MSLEIAELLIADPVAAWTAAGFRVDPDGVCGVAGVRLRLSGSAEAGSGEGILGWGLRGWTPDHGPDLDGVPTSAAVAGSAPESNVHPNGVTGIDHVVLLSPDLARTVDALNGAGLQPRRERDGELGGRPIRQVFYRLGPVIVELVGSPDVTGTGPASLWGVTFEVADIDASAAFLGERTSRVKDAVQPGRRITTLRHREFGMSVRTALISGPTLKS